MVIAATLGVLLALGPGAAPPASAQGKTLWLVQPLYPGQDMLVTRTEEALRRLMSQSQDQLVGRAALAAHLAGKKADLGCLTGDAACTDPVDALVASLGLERVVMLKGGQEDAAYRFKVTSYQPGTGETGFADGAGANLDKALLGALVKVVPLASTVEIASEPAGAAVFIDNEKVGVTPFSGMVLPGERLIKVEMASHMPSEKKVEVPVRGRLALTESLEKVPARIVLTGLPAGTGISIDGVKMGQDKVDKPIQPGKHKVEWALDGHLPIAEDVDVAPGATVTLDRTLAATGWTAFKTELNRVQEPIYKRGSSLSLQYEYASWWGNSLGAKENPVKGADEKDYLYARQALKRGPLQGLSLEYNQDGRYFGLMVVGLGYLTGEDWQYTLEHGENSKPFTVEPSQWATPNLFVLRAVQPHLRIAFWRFMLYGQAGFECRGLMLTPKAGSQHTTTLWVVDPLFTLQVSLRAYLVEGLYLQAGYRFSWDFFFEPAPLMGVQGGIGYAF
ncbi:MAG: PEGA domain-containing protein [Myxococcales bacterium]